MNTDDTLARARAAHAETDRQRVALMTTEVDSCLTGIGLAVTEYKIGDRKGFERSREHAEKAYSELNRMLTDPRHAEHLTAEQAAFFRTKLAELRQALDGLPD